MSYSGWAIVEMMGHKRVAGRISDTTFAGAQMALLEVPGEGDAFEPPQLISPGALYRVMFIPEEQARQEAEWLRPPKIEQLPPGRPSQISYWEEERNDDVEDAPSLELPP